MTLRDHLAALDPVRVVYTDLDGTLLGPGGSLLHDAGGEPTLVAAGALAAAARARVPVVPVSGRRAFQLDSEARLLGLRDAIAEVGTVIIRGGRHHYEWGAAPRGLAATPRAALQSARADEALLRHFAGDLRRYEPWDHDREGGVLLHGVVDVTAADRVLRDAGAGWAQLVDNGAASGWAGRAVRAYHLIPRGTGKAAAVADDLRARGIPPEAALAVGDSLEDATMAQAVGTYVIVGNGHGVAGANRFRVAGRYGAGFAEAVRAALAQTGSGRA